MLSSLSMRRCFAAAGFAICWMIFGDVTSSAAPFYRLAYATANNAITLSALNNDGDIAASGWTTNKANGAQAASAFLIRDGAIIDLFPNDLTPAAAGVAANVQVRINDANQIAMNYPWSEFNQARLYQAVADGLIQFSSSNFGAMETDGAIIATVRLFRAAGNSQPVTVRFQTADGDAKAGVRYVAQTGAIAWGPNESGDKIIRIPILHDPAYYAYQSFNLILSNPSNASLGDPTNAVLSITDPFPTVAFSRIDPRSAGYNVLQGETNVVITFHRAGGLDGTMTLTNVSTLDGGAQAGVDYVAYANAAPIVIPPSDAADRSFSIALLNAPTAGGQKSFGFLVAGYVDTPDNSIDQLVWVNLYPADQIPAPVFDATQPLLLPNRALELRVALAQGASIAIENSADMKTWFAVAVIKSTNGVVQFAAAIQPRNRSQFFRARLQ